MTSITRKLLTAPKLNFWILLLLTALNSDSLFGQKVKYAELTYLSVDTTFIPYSSFDTILLNNEIFVHPRDTMLAHIGMDSLTYIVSPDHIISHHFEVGMDSLHPSLKFEIWRLFDFKNERSYNFQINKKEEIEVKGSWELYQNWLGQDFNYPDITYVDHNDSFLGYPFKKTYYIGTKNELRINVKGKFTPDILFKLCVAPPHHQKTFYCPLDLHIEYLLDVHSIKHIQLLKVEEFSKKEFKRMVHKYIGVISY